MSQMIALGLQGILKLTRLQDRCLASPPKRIRALLANRG